MMEVRPYLEETLKILGRGWNGLITNYLSRRNDCSAHFSDMKRGSKVITSRALSSKLSEPAQWELAEKQVTSTSSIQTIYALIKKGKALAEALHPIEAWAQSYVDLTDQHTAK